MPPLIRRRAALAGAGLAAAATFFRPGRARAFGQFPSDASSLRIPDNLLAQNVLEVFLIGGISPYETFYCVEDFGRDRGEQWWAVAESEEMEAALETCGIEGGPLFPLGRDADGADVQLGPFAAALAARPDVLARLRMVVTAHGFAPHEVAVPLALTGRPAASPAAAGLGAHIARAARHLDVADRTVPYSFVMLPEMVVQVELTRLALASGLHPGTYRPFAIDLSAGPSFLTALSRPNAARSRDAFDRLSAQYSVEFDRLRTARGSQRVLRSDAVDDLTWATRTMADAARFEDLLPAEAFSAVPGESCGDSVPRELTAMSLESGVRLLNDPDSPARYVCVLDGGFGAQASAGAYDAHADLVGRTGRNLHATLRSLMTLINAPGESDPNKIDLDKTMIILNTEFGRTPYLEGQKGRGHWPGAYPVLYLGGPVTTDNAGIVGAITESAGAKDPVNPAQHRIAAMLAMGFWPFESESFNVQDVPGAQNEVEAAAAVLRDVLGYDS